LISATAINQIAIDENTLITVIKPLPGNLKHYQAQERLFSTSHIIKSPFCDIAAHALVIGTISTDEK